MNRKVSGIRFFCLFSVLLLAGSGLWGSEVVDRLRDRVGDIDRLLQAELVGENNEGLLTVRGELDPADAELVEAENADRLQVYVMIAGKTGEPVERVAAQRAKQITQRSKPGIWLQDPKGDWYRK